MNKESTGACDDRSQNAIQSLAATTLSWPHPTHSSTRQQRRTRVTNVHSHHEFHQERMKIPFVQADWLVKIPLPSDPPRCHRACSRPRTARTIHTSLVSTAGKLPLPVITVTDGAQRINSPRMDAFLSRVHHPPSAEVRCAIRTRAPAPRVILDPNPHSPHGLVISTAKGIHSLCQT